MFYRKLCLDSQKSSINNADNFVDIILTMHTQCNVTEKSVLKMVTRKGTSAEYHKYYFYKKMFVYHIQFGFILYSSIILFLVNLNKTKPDIVNTYSA